MAPSDRDDLLQEVLLAAYRGLERYDSREVRAAAEGLMRLHVRADWDPLHAWLFGIAWRRVCHYRNRAHRRREIPVGLAVGAGIRALSGRGEEPDPERTAGKAEGAALMSAVLARMDLRRRGVLILHDVLDLSIAAIARELGLNRNTVQNHLRLARDELRRALLRLSDDQREAAGVPRVTRPSRPRHRP